MSPHIPLAVHVTHTDGPPTPPQPSVAERRQLTVLFCNLVDSTALAGRLDPEDLRDVVRTYQQACATVIQRFEGHIAQYLGDGLLVYFGYPQAHEDDAQRAVQTGLGMVEAILLSVPLPENRYPPLSLSPQRHKQKTLETLLAILLEHAAVHPTLLIMEDLHWVDPTTVEWLSLVVDQAPTTSLCLLMTCRPEFQPPWGSRSYLTQMTLNRLPRTQVAQMVELLADRVTGGQPFPAEVMQHLVEKSDGIPLFVEEMTKTVLESTILTADEREHVYAGPGSTMAIPATLQDSLMARLDRLVTAKGLAQLGATLGRHFSYALLQAVAQLDEETLQRELQRLVTAELLFQRGMPPQATYLFKHALIQDVAYQSLLKSTRQHYHQRIAQVLEARFPEVVAIQPELLAHHYTAAGCTELAVAYWQRAGQHASDHSANVEAISHFTTGIELLQTLSETPEHIQQILTLYIALGAALLMTKGLAAPEVEHAYTQAHALCQQVDETSQLVPVLFGLWRFYIGRSQFQITREVGETLLRLAQRAHYLSLSVIARYALGFTWLCLGLLSVARQHFEEGITLYTPDQRRAPAFRIGQDLGVGCRAYAAMTLWLLGYPEQALVRLHDTLALAHALSHPFSLVWAHAMGTFISQFRRDVQAAHGHAEVAVTLSIEQGFPLYTAHGTILRGWALAMQGQGEEGMIQVHRGIAAYQATGAALAVPWFYIILAEVSDHLGHPEDGLQALAEAHTLVEQHESAGGKRKSIVFGASCSYGKRKHSRRKRKPGCTEPWTSLAASRPSPWSCAPP